MERDIKKLRSARKAVHEQIEAIKKTLGKQLSTPLFKPFPLTEAGLAHEETKLKFFERQLEEIQLDLEHAYQIEKMYASQGM